MRNIGYQIHSIVPGQVEIKSGRLHAAGHYSDQFVLELDREELRKFRPEVRSKLLAEATCLNDVRSLILVHDKRILAVLHDEEIMRDLLSIDEYAFLRPFLIPSFSLEGETEKETILKAPGDWILKRTSGGRGLDMHRKSDCEPRVWEALLRERGDEFMAQPFVRQQAFRYGRDGGSLNLVGMLLCCDGETSGPGIFRGSSENAIINLHQGRSHIFPCLLPKSVMS